MIDAEKQRELIIKFVEHNSMEILQFIILIGTSPPDWRLDKIMSVEGLLGLGDLIESAHAAGIDTIGVSEGAFEIKAENSN